MLGLLHADGHYDKQHTNGKITLEASMKDVDIAHKLSKVLPGKSTITYRNRHTNYSKDSQTFVWSIYDKDIRTQFPMPSGKKSHLIAPPDIPYSKVDYWRGIIDGDGSLGFTSQGLPFISLVTQSEALKETYIDFLEPILGYRKRLSRNTRDNVYNIVIFNEAAQSLANKLYYLDCLAIARKYEVANQLKQWERSIPQRPRSLPWEQWEEQYLQTHTLDEAIKYLSHRTKKAIKLKHYRISG